MQQLKQVEHKNEEQEQKRECKGRRLAITGKIYRLQNTDDVFYVESESSNDTYYLVKYNLSDSWCSCRDNSMRSGQIKKCKHIWSIEYSIRLATVKVVDKLPLGVKQDNNTVAQDWRSDSYDF